MEPTDLIVHHHDAGYYSEKVRRLMGVRGLTWYSVIEPLISPKPELERLTGGYQRVPALQVGADVYCDTKVILAELDRRAPDVAAPLALDFVVNAWVDKVLTPATFAVALPDMADSMAPNFVADRAAIYGPAFDLEAIAGASAPMHGQWRAQVAWLEEALAAGEGPFLCGEAAGVADVAAFIPLWIFAVRGAMASSLSRPEEPIDTPPPFPADPDPDDHTERLLDGFDRVRAWRDRMAAIGDGDRREASHEEAFAVARACEPAPAPEHDRSDPSGLSPGAEVTVIADDSERDPVSGTLVALNSQRVVVGREDDDLGRIHVHFPRFSYFVTQTT